jgi:hypothetical protein
MSSIFRNRCVLEIDQMQGTSLPPSVTIDGIEYNLQKAFRDAGIDFVKSSGDQVNLDTPFDNDGEYSDGELENMMNSFSNRRRGLSAGDTNLYAYLLIVNGFSTRGKATLGVMFDSNRREGTAVFYSAVRTNPYFFLRTTIHEIGHQFNLHHEDASSEIIGNKRKFSIMNQTQTIQRSPDTINRSNPIENIGYFFGELEKMHLDSHPIQFVEPGGSPFQVPPGGASVYGCIPEHVQWHQYSALFKRLGYGPDPGNVGVDRFSGQSQNQNPKIEFTIQMGKKEYLPGQPAIAYMELKNKSQDTISISPHLEPEYELTHFYIKKEAKEEVQFKPYAMFDYLLTETSLKPNESIKGTAKIFYGSHGYSFPEPGIYKVRATYNGIIDKPNLIVESNTVQVNVREPQNKEEKDQADLIYGDEQARLFLFEGGDHLSKGLSKLGELAKKYPNSVPGGYANSVLGVNLKKAFKDIPNKRIREPKPEEAESYLKNAVKSTTGHFANIASLNLADIYKQKKDTESMKNVLSNFIDKFSEDEKSSDSVRKAKDRLESK